MLSSVARSAFFSVNFKSSFNLHPPRLEKPAAAPEFLDAPIHADLDFLDASVHPAPSRLDTIPHDDAPFLKHLHSGTTLLNPGASPSPLTLSSPFLTADNATAGTHTDSASTSGTLVADAPSVSADEFEVLRVLGEGGFGRVFHVRDRATGRAHALKVVSKERLKPKSHKLVLSEQRVLSAVFGAPGFLQLDASWHDAQHFFFLTELVPNGTLRAEIKRKKRLAPAAARFYTAELLLALERLHAVQIVHRDVKPENLLLGADGHLVLADFGLSRILAPEGRAAEVHAAVPLAALGMAPGQDYTRTPCGTMRYMAPEALFALPYSFGVDVWAMGVVLHVMCCGRVPFGANVGKKEYRQALLNEPLNFMAGEVDPCTQDLLERLLTKNPIKRPKLSEVKTHPFFAAIDWDALARKEVAPPCIPATKSSTIHFRDSHKLRAVPFASPNDDPYPDFAFVAPTFREGKFDAFGKYMHLASKGADITSGPTRRQPGTSSASLQWDEARRHVQAFILGIFRARRGGNAKAKHASSPTLLEAAVPLVNSWLSVHILSACHGASGHGDPAEGMPEANVLARVKRWLEKRRLWAAARPRGKEHVAAVSEMAVPVPQLDV